MVCREGASRITDEARADMMDWRRLFPAICVGSGTVLADNPSLTARLPEETFCPNRLVLDSRLSTFEQSISQRTVYTDKFSSKTKVITTSVGLKNKNAVKRADDLSISLIEAKQDEHGRVDLSEMQRILKELDLSALYCEGGAKIAHSLMNHNLVNYLFRYRSPKRLNGPNALSGPKLDNFVMKDSIAQKFGEDTLTHGFL